MSGLITTMPHLATYFASKQAERIIDDLYDKTGEIWTWNDLAYIQRDGFIAAPICRYDGQDRITGYIRYGH